MPTYSSSLVLILHVELTSNNRQLWEPGDMLFVYDCDYECTLLGARRLFDEKGVTCVEVKIELPCTDEVSIVYTSKNRRYLPQINCKS